MSKFRFAKTTFLALALCAATAIVSPAQTLTTLASFDGTNGKAPWVPSALVQGSDGNFYGTTSAGGANNSGTVFKVSPDGTVTTLYSFCAQSNCTDGASPYSGLIQGTNGNFYGTTYFGGASTLSEMCYGPQGCGTVFEITSEGALTTLYNFCSVIVDGLCADGSAPSSGVIQGTDGNLYGTTQYGGDNAFDNNFYYCCSGGTAFKLTLSGQLTTLYQFCSVLTTNGEYCLDGGSPNGLVQATNGNLYGTTYGGGSGVDNSGGTIFQLTTSGTLTTLYSFCAKKDTCPDGAYPFSGLIQAKNGNFYGTTRNGGHDSWGTVFQVTSAGVLTTLHRFRGSNISPYAPLIQGKGGNFYGVADNAIFSITAAGDFKTLFTFTSANNWANGSNPTGLVQGTNGDLYGTAAGGGADGDGTVFSLSMNK